MNKNIKIATFIITSNTYPAARNTKMQKKLFSKRGFDNNLTFWYRGGDLSELENQKFKVSGKDLLINTSDKSIDMGKKTLLALEWLYSNHDFDFFVRPTPSSYLHYKNLVEFINNNLLNEEYVYCGQVQDTKDKNGNFFEFVSGSTFILNKKSVKAVLENQISWDHEYWDDVALAKLMYEIGIKPQNFKRFDVEGNVLKQEISKEYYQYRCRSDNHYGYPRFLETRNLKLTDKIVNNEKIGFLSKFFNNIYFELSKKIYIYQFGWKTYLIFRKLAKALLSKRIYSFFKNLFYEKIQHFKHVRFKI